MYVDRQRYTVFWPYTVCRPNTKTKISRTSGHRRSVFFFLDVAIRNSLRSNKTLVCTRDVVCVIQHRDWPLRSTILNAHGTNASPDGLCTRTRNEVFSCWFCCDSFSIDRARRGNVCLEDQAKAYSPTDQPVLKFKYGLRINMTMKTFFTFRTE